MLKKGIYEHVINQITKQHIHEIEQQGMVCMRQNIDEAESPQILANYFGKVIRQKLEEIENQEDRVNLINNILKEAGVIDEIQIAEPSKLLTEVMSRQQALLQAESRIQTIRPISGFRVSNLFTGGSSLLPLGEEIRREIASANEINFIVSFLKVSGVRILLDDLLKFCQKEGNRLRIITTTYCGATQAKAIEQLAALPNTEIRISYNTDIERLHAKSYIFVRNSGMNTAYIGSSNLSKSAQTEGLEWNIRVTSVENPHIIKTALATFEMYWNSSNFEDFRLGGIEKFNKEIHRNIFRDTSNEVIYRHFTKDDFMMLHKRAPFTQQSCIELQDYVRQFGIQDKSLQKIYAILFKEKISKSQRLSNWEADVLSDGQKQYAATDAWACLNIYNLLQELKQTGDWEVSPLTATVSPAEEVISNKISD